MPPKKNATVYRPGESAEDNEIILLSDDETNPSPPKRQKTQPHKKILNTLAVAPKPFVPSVLPPKPTSGSLTRSMAKASVPVLPSPPSLPAYFGMPPVSLATPFPGMVAGSPSAAASAYAGSSPFMAMASFPAFPSMSVAYKYAKPAKTKGKKPAKGVKKPDPEDDEDSEDEDDDDDYMSTAAAGAQMEMTFGFPTGSGVMPGVPYAMPPGQSVVYAMPPGMHQSWDPAAKDWDAQAPTAICTKRMQKDLAMVLEQEEETRIYVAPEEKDITRFSALIIGPEDTPYQGGFFVFSARVAPTYPMVPPRVKILTTDEGKVRFGPNLYNCGKVCLSILGTWSGPGWTPAMNLSAVLQSIQSLMSADALRNEPGHESMKKGDKSLEAYDRRVRYDATRVAVLGNLEKALAPNSQVPKKFREAMFRHFEAGYDALLKSCQDNLALQKQPPAKPSKAAYYADYGYGNQAAFEWDKLLERLIQIRPRVQKAIYASSD